MPEPLPKGHLHDNTTPPHTDRELTQSMHPSPTAPDAQSRASNGPVVVLAWTMFLVPAVGVPSELMLQDTLKSAVVAFGVLTAAMLFFWQQRHRTAPLQWHGLVWLPMVLMLYALGSMVWSHAYLAGVEAIRWFLLSLMLWLGLNTLTRDNIPALLWGIHWGAVAASVWAALQFWLDFSFFPQGAGPSSTFVNRNFFAEYAVSALPFSVYLLANMRASRWLPWMALSLVLEVVALMMTGTRSALVAMVVLVPVFALILLRYRSQFAFSGWSKASKLLVGLVLVGGFLVLGSEPPQNQNVTQESTTALQRSLWRTVSIAKPEEYTTGSFSIRAIMWKATARMVMAAPLTGVGAGAWEVQIPLFQGPDNAFETDYYAHNEYLQLLAEYGVVVGGLFLAVLFAYLLVAAGKTWQLMGARSQEAPIRAIALASMLTLLIVSNAGFPWRLASTGALLALNLSLLAATDVRLGFKEAFFALSLRSRPRLSRTLLPPLTACFALAVFITYQAAEAERKIVKSIQMGNAAAKLSQARGVPSPERSARLLENIREGIEINPHYRKLTPMVADQLAELGDWENAIWIWKSVAASRPHIAAIWSNLAKGYAQQGENEQALDAVYRWQRLEPNAIDSLALEVTLLGLTGKDSLAVRKITGAYDQGRFDFALLQTGYAMGLKTHDWSLAIRSLELRNQTWPEHAADGYFRLGSIYANENMGNEIKALAAFRHGWSLVSTEQQKEKYRNQVPLPYREQM